MSLVPLGKQRNQNSNPSLFEDKTRGLSDRLEGCKALKCVTRAK